MKKDISSWIICLLIFPFSFAQSSANDIKCKKVNAWTDQVAAELPERYLTRNSQPYKNLVYNLYTDKYFVPVFGKPYTELSASKRLKLYYKLRECNSSFMVIEPHLLGPLMSETKKTNFRVDNGIYSHQTILKSIVEIEKTRKKFNHAIRRLEDSPGSWEMYELSSLQGELRTTYLLLLPSEKELLTEKITLTKQQLVRTNIRKELKRLEAEETSYRKFSGMNNLLKSQRRSTQVLDANELATLQQEIDEKSFRVLDELMELERSKISLEELDEKSVSAYNQAFLSFNDRYGRYKRSSPSVKETWNFYLKHKSSVIATIKDELEDKINSAGKVSELRKIRDVYIMNTQNSNSDVAELNSLLKERERALIAAKIQADAEERRKEEEKEFRALMVKMNDTTPTGEPNAWQMEFALRAQISGVNSNFENMNTDIKGAKNSGEQLDAIVGALYNNSKVSMSNFKKYSCEKAVGRPGYNCDFQVKYSISNPQFDVSWANTMMGTEVQTARFSKVNGFWIIVQRYKN